MSPLRSCRHLLTKTCPHPIACRFQCWDALYLTTNRVRTADRLFKVFLSTQLPDKHTWTSHQRDKTKTDKDTTTKENCGTISLMNIGLEIRNKILVNQTNNTIKGSYIMIKCDLTHGCRVFKICKSISLIHDINKLKNKNHVIISLDAESF